MSEAVWRPEHPVENLLIGAIIEVDGTHIVAELDATIADLSRVYAGEMYAVGQFGSIVRVHFGRKIIYGYVSRLRMKSDYYRELGYRSEEQASTRVVEADLFGEAEYIRIPGGTASEWQLNFERGVVTFPLPQQRLYLTPKAELVAMFSQSTKAILHIGDHVGAANAPCFADMNELLGKHTAILGSTGSGKSAAVAAVLHSIIDRGKEKKYQQWDPTVIILDPHNEYASAFEGNCNRLSTDEGTLQLPYWLLDFQETIALVIAKTEFAATSQTNIIKAAMLHAREAAAATLGIDPTSITVDSPVPYQLDVFIGHISAGATGTAADRKPYLSILHKLEILRKDSRMSFMMSPWEGRDTLPDVMRQFLGGDKLIRIVDLSGVPNEVAGAASAAIARLLFSFKLWQSPLEREANPVLLVCEEAHRYVPKRGEAQYEAAQEAVMRLAKEGRKYGIGLMLVSQRPSEVEDTVLSQCNSWIVLRLTNDVDREHVRSILPDSLAGLTKVLSGLRRQEAVFVGQAAMLPSRIRIRDLTEAQLPRSHDIDFDAGWQNEWPSEAQLAEVGRMWRSQSRPSDRKAL